MSVDLEVWSPQIFKQPDDIFARPKWCQQQSGWVYLTSGWQIVVDESVEVDPDDVPTEIGPRLAGVHYLTRLSLEPGSAPRSALSLLRKTAREVALRCSGLVYDPQEDAVFGPRGNTRSATKARERSLDLLALSWWFVDGPLTTREGARDLLAYLARHTPQFLPKRYGEFEPPKHRFDGNRIEHFLELVFTNPFGGVWHTGSLFEVYYHPTHGPGWQWFPGLGDYGFAVPYLTIRCPFSLIEETAWHSTLQCCWKAITAQARPIYSDVRVLHGYLAKGNRITSRSGEAELHPIRGCWRGLPRTLGLAVAVGEPYLSLWPEVKHSSDGADHSVATHCMPDWRTASPVSELTGSPPKSLCQPNDAIWTEEVRRLPDGSDVWFGHLTCPTELASQWPFTPRPVR